jgi:hypothetical protein
MCKSCSTSKCYWCCNTKKKCHSKLRTVSKPGISVFTQSEVSTETEDISTSDMHCAKYRAGQLPAHEVAKSHSVRQNFPHNTLSIPVSFWNRQNAAWTDYRTKLQWPHFQTLLTYGKNTKSFWRANTESDWRGLPSRHSSYLFSYAWYSTCHTLWVYFRRTSMAFGRGIPTCMP